MTSVLALAVVVSIDNARLGLVLGMLGIRGRRRLGLAISACIIEGVVPLLGLAASAWGGAEAGWREPVGPIALIGAGGLVAVQARGAQRVQGFSPRALYLLPALFGIDNLFAGAALQALAPNPLVWAAVVGSVSGSLAFVTMALGERLAAAGARRHWVSPALMTMALGCSFFLWP
jgi:putative Mn2+ efflux pump MntP